MVLGSQQHLFEIPEGICYLDCAKMSVNLRAVTDAGVRAVARKSAPWNITAADFFDESEQVRAMFARLVGGDADGVAILPSVSYGIGIASLNLPIAAGHRILVLSDQFPSNVYPWRATGATVEAVPRDAGGWTAGVLDRLAGDVAAVAIPHCHWTDGTNVDLVAVREAADQVGAALVVDATQSLGAYPFDVTEIRPDFVVAAAYKWLLGPYSLGFMWAARRWREGTPLEWNWITRAGSDDFTRLVDYSDDFAPGARRYDVGERSNFALLPMAIAALDQLLAWGVNEVQDTLAALTASIESGTRALGLDPVPASNRAGHMLGVRVPAGVSPQFGDRLAEAGVHISVRADSLRISPHLWNTPDDVDRFLDVLTDA